VDAGAKAALKELSKSFPPGLEYAVAFDSTTVVGDSIREVLVTLAEAISIVIIVIFLFLLDWRATIIRFGASSSLVISRFNAKK